MKTHKILLCLVTAACLFAASGCLQGRSVTPDKVPSSIGPYSQATVAGNLVFTSGQLPISPLTNNMPGGIAAQTRQAMENVRNVLASAGSSLDNTVKITIYLKDMNDFDAMNDVYATYFKNGFPARSCVQVARIPRDALIEIEAVAVR